MSSRKHNRRGHESGRTIPVLAAVVAAVVIAVSACGGTTDTVSTATIPDATAPPVTNDVAVDVAESPTASADPSSAVEGTDNASPTDDASPTGNASPTDIAAEPADSAPDAPAAEASDDAAEPEVIAVEPTAEPVVEPVAVSREEAAAAAAVNVETIVGGNNWRTSEVLDVTTGAITTLAGAVDGDRPVLVWFWAPH